MLPLGKFSLLPASSHMLLHGAVFVPHNVHPYGCPTVLVTTITLVRQYRVYVGLCRRVVRASLLLSVWCRGCVRTVGRSIGDRRVSPNLLKCIEDRVLAASIGKPSSWCSVAVFMCFATSVQASVCTVWYKLGVCHRPSRGL